MASSSVDTMRPIISPPELSAPGPPLAGAKESISSMKITDGAAARAAANTPCALHSLQGVLIGKGLIFHARLSSCRLQLLLHRQS